MKTFNNISAIMGQAGKHVMGSCRCELNGELIGHSDSIIIPNSPMIQSAMQGEPSYNGAYIKVLFRRVLRGEGSTQRDFLLLDVQFFRAVGL
jgi:hypothetical protein